MQSVETVHLSDRETYILSLIWLEGDNTPQNTLTDVILGSRGPFAGLGKPYVKYTLVPKQLGGLVNRGMLETSHGRYRLTSDAISILSEGLTGPLKDAISGITQFRREHVLDYRLAWVEKWLFSGRNTPPVPREVVRELKEAVELYQTRQPHDSVITKCGRSIEILVREVNEMFQLVRGESRTGGLLVKFTENDVIRRISDRPDERDIFKRFAKLCSDVYKLRSKLGAHYEEGMGWGQDQVAISTLVLTFYLLDLFVIRIYPLHLRGEGR